jgi:hypothetical protein
MRAKNTVMVDETPCPVCKTEHNAATAIDGKHVSPKPGDISICYECATILEYGDNLQLQIYDIERLFEEFTDDERITIIREQKRIANRNKKTDISNIGDNFSFIDICI